MAQLVKGTTFATGNTVTASNLNGLVDNGSLAGGAITDQVAASSVLGSDYVLINQAGTLKKATIDQLSANVSTAGLIKADGTVPMTGQLILATTQQTSSLQAVSKGYVDAAVIPGGTTALSGLVQKSGDTMTGNLTMGNGSAVILNGTSANPLSAVPLGYVTQQISTLATSAALSAHTSNTNNPHSTTASQVGLGNVDNTSDQNKPVSLAQQTALNTKLSLTGGTLTGFLGLVASAPVQAYDATPKTYVDTQLALKTPYAGSVVLPSTGSWLFQGGLEVAATGSSDTSVVNRQYVDALFSARPRVVAGVWFKSATCPATTIDTSTFLPVTFSRTAGSATTTIGYSTLSASYSDPTQPFFLAGQYIGIASGTTGITARLYKIESTNIAAKTFTITTPETTALSASGFLSSVYNGVATTTAYNTKSVYVCFASNKHYVNFWADTSNGSKTNATPSAVSYANVSGSAYSYNNYNLNWLFMPNMNRTTYLYSQNVAEGFGATTMGCHVGAFYTKADGSGYNYMWDASIGISYR
jgi:hypothetical protein